MFASIEALITRKREIFKLFGDDKNNIYNIYF